MRVLLAALRESTIGTSATLRGDPTMSAEEGQSGRAAEIVGGPSLTPTGLSQLRPPPPKRPSSPEGKGRGYSCSRKRNNAFSQARPEGRESSA